MIMKASRFQVLLVAAVLILSLSHGSGREVRVAKFGYRDEERLERGREIMQLDYLDAGPNFNSRAGYLFSPPSSPPPPPPPPPPPSQHHHHD